MNGVLQYLLRPPLIRIAFYARTSNAQTTTELLPIAGGAAYNHGDIIVDGEAYIFDNVSAVRSCCCLGWFSSRKMLTVATRSVTDIVSTRAHCTACISFQSFERSANDGCFVLAWKSSPTCRARLNLALLAEVSRGC